MDQTDILSAFPDTPPRRVVSLVPSTTESLFDLGFGEAVVGITDFCIHPDHAVMTLPKVGGPKNPRVEEILALEPDLVIANQEENTRPSVEALRSAGVPVWVAFPQTVQAAVEDLYALARLFRSDTALMRVQSLERSLEWALLAAEDQPRRRYFCPIWQDHLETGEMWWMTFNDRTYSADLLRLLGGENIFAARERRYPMLADLGRLTAEDPGDRDTRYPRVTKREVTAGQPEIILLPSEPYAYRDEDVAKFSDWFSHSPAAQGARIYTVDGTLLTWCGTRLALALSELPGLFAI